MVTTDKVTVTEFAPYIGKTTTDYKENDMGVKEYELPDGRKAVFEFDENGVGKITLEAMDLLMGLIKADLVRCGECKQLDHTKWCDFFLHYMNDDDFCSYGERRAE